MHDNIAVLQQLPDSQEVTIVVVTVELMQWWLSYYLWPPSFVIYEIRKVLCDASLGIWKSWFERFGQYLWEAQFIVFPVFWGGDVKGVDSGAVYKQ